MTKTLCIAKRSVEYPCEFIENATIRLTATAEITYIFGNYAPHFSLTAREHLIDSRKKYVSIGCMHETIAECIPEWEQYLKWHLVSFIAPMHYIENSLYWLGFSGWCNGLDNDPPNYAHFESTCVYGALDSDYKFDYKNATKKQVTAWLKRRLPKLRKAFLAAMIQLYGEENKTEIMNIWNNWQSICGLE